MKIEEMRRYLKSYQLIIKEIKSRVNHLEWLKREIYYPLQNMKNFNEKALLNAQQSMLKIIMELQGDISQFEEQATEIEKLICCLPHDERLVVYARYILGVKWLDVPAVVNYEIAQCQRLERRAILNLIKQKKRTKRI